MDPALLTVVIALAAAAACAAVAWRSVDDQRRRSAARVAALAAAVDADSKAVVEAGFSQLEHEPVSISGMFTTTPGAAVGGRPLIKAAVIGAMAVALVVVAAMANRDHGDSPAVEQAAAPLELVAMRHARSGDDLTVTGMVRNPRAGATVASVAAVVSAFNRNGAMVTSAEAPLDLLTLGPGEESPFVVKLRNAAEVGRYRVSFRTGSGVIRHVDRRADTQRAPAQVALHTPAK